MRYKTFEIKNHKRLQTQAMIVLLQPWACLRWGSGGHDPPKFLKSTICPPNFWKEEIFFLYVYVYAYNNIKK